MMKKGITKEEDRYEHEWVLTSKPVNLIPAPELGEMDERDFMFVRRNRPTPKDIERAQAAKIEINLNTGGIGGPGTSAANSSSASRMTFEGALEILKIEDGGGLSKALVDRAFRRLSKKCHPDKFMGRAETGVSGIQEQKREEWARLSAAKELLLAVLEESFRNAK